MLLEQNRPGVSENGGTANLVPGKTTGRALAWAGHISPPLCHEFQTRIAIGQIIVRRKSIIRC
ncbi:hypothetical protein AB7714_26310 [Tardiphaga sp. 1201_B9_N1_1]|uniref:hypothetical protein n=1 Tax=unclassified Tardiphaga TaxID=2631404 RepID=UPI003F246A15